MKRRVKLGDRFNRLLFVGGVLLALVPLAPALAEETTLIPLGATWKYLDDGSDQGSAWSAPSYNDAGWAAGPAELGYGDGDEATVVSFGSDSGNKYITTYFRHSFQVIGAASLVRADLRLKRDDGAVVYLNGTEVFRSNMPGGMITFLTTASATADENSFFDSTVSPALLLEGTNVLAVEIHQVSGTSSDISLDLELTASDSSEQVVRGPYLQRSAPNEITIRWRTDAVTDGRVRYGTSLGNLNQIADDTAIDTDHEVTVASLNADTQYFYSVGTAAATLVGDDADHFFVTPPIAGTVKDTRIWVIGDSGTGNANARAVRDAYLTFSLTRPADLWLMLGDNAYPDGTDSEYQGAVFDTYPGLLGNTVVWPTLGNHDGHTADSATESGPYYDIFTLPTLAEAGGVFSGTEAYYSFDYANIHFVCLESYETDRSPGGAMLTWLQDDLTANNADWTIAFWHHPPYSKGSHNSDTEGRLIDMRQNALPILEDNGVDLVLTGHSHSYERSFLLDQHYGSSGTLQSFMILDSGDGQTDGDGAYQKPSVGPTPHEGAVYAVAGSSGQTSGGSLNHPAMFISLNQLGSLVLDINDNVLDGQFLNSNGVVTDHFTIEKGGGFGECGNGVKEFGEQCDGADLGGASCSDQGCTGGVPSCTVGCTLDYSTCSGCPVCDNDGVCEVDEDCNGCPNDCVSGSGFDCGNGLCEAGNGEDCLSCPEDCNGKQNGNPSNRFCCGDGDGQNPAPCTDSRCSTGGFSCTDVPVTPSCCGDGTCEGIEDSIICEVDCGAPPVCSDGFCDPGEDSCNCALDCGAPPPSESLCTDGFDEDCDGLTDCQDADCGSDPACLCEPLGASCVADIECCSLKCRGPSGGKRCR